MVYFKLFDKSCIKMFSMCRIKIRAVRRLMDLKMQLLDVLVENIHMFHMYSRGFCRFHALCEFGCYAAICR